MSQEKLTVEARELRGKRNAKRLRQAGKVPAVLYGHGQESVALALDNSELRSAIRHNVQLFGLTGAANESALLKEVQWDAFGSNVLHVDLTRVDADEMVTVEVRLKLRGIAAGIKMGGVVELAMRKIEIECTASSIPEEIEVKVNDLEMGDSLTAGDLELPSKAKLTIPEDSVVVSCHEPTVQAEEEDELATDGVEPEIIGEKKEEEGGGE